MGCVAASSAFVECSQSFNRGRGLLYVAESFKLQQKEGADLLRSPKMRNLRIIETGTSEQFSSCTHMVLGVATRKKL
jgi:hypothetical protein